MGPIDSIDLNPNHLATVKAILAEHVAECEVRAFGSRATWTAKDYSDLDLAVVGEGPMEWKALGRLKEAFEESDLPMRVDVLDWHAISESFHRQIQRDYVVVQESTNRTVADERRETPFSQLLAEPVRNGVYKKKELHGRGVKVVNMGELFANPRLRDVDMRRVELSESEQQRFSVQAGDLLFARRSLVAEGAGKCSVVLEINEPTAFESSIIRARPDPTTADSLFLYYYFNSPIGLHALDTIRRQVTVAGITGTDLAQLPVRVPSLPEQRAIAHVLGTLDDKIELNRRMNQTLEEMARALFKSWFVDFDPVRAKMDGRWRRGGSLPGLPADLYDLFPDRLVPSKLGEIPEEWKVGTVSLLAKRIQNGGTPKRSEPAYWDMGDIPWLTSGEVRQSFVLDTETFVTQLGLERSSAKMIPARSILVALYGATAGQVSMNVRPLTTNQAVSAIIPSDGNRYFCLVSLKSQVGELGNRAVGSAQQNISKKAVESTIVVLPPIEPRLKFDTIVEGLVERIFRNLGESRALAAQRDVLLPKLVSGEVDMGKHLSNLPAG